MLLCPKHRKAGLMGTLSYPRKRPPPSCAVGRDARLPPPLAAVPLALAPRERASRRPLLRCPWPWLLASAPPAAPCCGALGLGSSRARLPPPLAAAPLALAPRERASRRPLLRRPWPWLLASAPPAAPCCGALGLGSSRARLPPPLAAAPLALAPRERASRRPLL